MNLENTDFILAKEQFLALEKSGYCSSDDEEFKKKFKNYKTSAETYFLTCLDGVIQYFHNQIKWYKFTVFTDVRNRVSKARIINFINELINLKQNILDVGFIYDTSLLSIIPRDFIIHFQIINALNDALIEVFICKSKSDIYNI